MTIKCSSNVVSALGLCSGGLDSILSALLLREQNIKVFWVSFETPFFSSEKAKYAAKKNNIPLFVKNITKVYMEMLTNPNCKFGKNMNPCTDCHTLMFKMAGQIMLQEGFDFMFSGEVLGQRPMSQNRFSLRYVEKNSNFTGYILRPLSAKLLPETTPEKNNLVNRSLLMDIEGRSRKKQMSLAARLGLKDYPSPGGGCLLTDKSYSNRLRDLIDHQDFFSERNLHLLKLGRHMRLDGKTKLIVGRNLAENEALEYHVNLEHDIIIKTYNVPGPLVLMPGGKVVINPKMLSLASSICAGYSKSSNALVDIRTNLDINSNYTKVKVLPLSESKKFLIL